VTPSPDGCVALSLPPIILDAGYNIPKKANFFHNLTSILVFAFIGTFISTMVIGSTLWLCSIAICPDASDCDGEGQPKSLGFEQPAIAFKFGSMLSATDPVATLSVLSSLSGLKDPNLYNVIFGKGAAAAAAAAAASEGRGGEGRGARRALGQKNTHSVHVYRSALALVASGCCCWGASRGGAGRVR
jgi:sodium/hydrogen exchanger 8